jgi:hypothetical protein
VAGLLLAALRVQLLVWQVWLAVFAECLLEEEPAHSGAGRDARVWIGAFQIYVAGFVLAPELIPSIATFRDDVAPGFAGQLLSLATGMEVKPGGLLLGWGGFSLAASYLASEFLVMRRLRRPGATLVGLVGVWLVVNCGITYPCLTKGGLPISYAPAVACTAALLGLWIRNTLVPLEDRSVSSLGAGRRGRLWLTSASVCAGILVGLALHPETASPVPVRPKVVVLNEGGFDWDVPRHGKYSLFSGGMFGLLPYYVEGIQAVSSVDLARALASGPDILMLVNCHRVWQGADRDVVFRYVERGGHLLVLGDHTNVFGLMEGYNSLLQPMGCRFRFDSAYPLYGSFTGKVRHHAHGVANWYRGDKLGISIGASLEVSPPWTPVLSLRWGHSDEGAETNWMGSFLGNYSYDVGERLGDLILVATRDYGKGRIVVFGDTSGFQNGSLTDGYLRYVYPVFRWTALPSNPLHSATLRIFALVLLGATLILRLAWGSRELVPILPYATLILISAFAGEFNARRLWAPDETGSAPPVLVDHSHGPLVGHYESRKRSIGPLYSNLLRAGLRVHDLTEWDLARVRQSKAVVVVEPSRPIASDDAEGLLSYVSGGGTVIFAGGPEASARWEAFLGRTGLGVSPVPLGALPPHPPARHRRPGSEGELSDVAPLANSPGGSALRPDADAPTLPSAWEVSISDPRGTEILYSVGERSVAVQRRLGSGRVVVIGDAGVFSNANVEGVWGYSSSTVRWLFLLFQSTLGGTLDGLANPFPEPVKPQDM